ncbi:MAG: ribosomal protein S18-alanine N-acetyltransferase [Candidatus Nanopelagicales bacterium]|nr:ribosomal protein S18-alanine N-acetyltransferase [Candidatus Nanopelagicales bacterium]
MSLPPTLEPMRWWHIEAVHALEQQLFPVDAWSVEQFWSELAQPTRSYCVAVDDGAILGYFGLFALAPDADVQTIAVSPAAQGRGLGAVLLRELIDQALARGCEQLMLEVRSDNTPALALYDRFGFEQLHVRRDYYAPGVDALVMRLRPLMREAVA